MWILFIFWIVGAWIACAGAFALFEEGKRAKKNKLFLVIGGIIITLLSWIGCFIAVAILKKYRKYDN